MLFVARALGGRHPGGILQEGPGKPQVPYRFHVYVVKSQGVPQLA